MSHLAKTVARQASFLMIASVLQKAVAFFAFTFAARRLGVEGVGSYFYVISISSLAAAWTDLGLTPVVIRAFSASEEEGWRFVFTAVRAKALFIPLAAVGALVGTLVLGGHELGFFSLLLLALVVMAEDAISLLGYGILRGRQRLDIESLGMVLGQLLSSGFLVLAVSLGWGVTGAVFALVLGSAWHMVWSASWVWRVSKIPLELPPQPWRVLARSALPFALAGVLVRIYSSVDSLLLKYLEGTEAVGRYAVAYKMTYALQFLPLAFVAALYPALSAAFAKNDEKALVQTALGSWRFMAILGFPLAAALSAFAPRLLPFVYGAKFLAAVPILAVLAWVLPLIFLDFPVGSYLNATHQANKKTGALGVAVFVEVVGNLILIPLFGGIGAAWSAVASFTVLLGLGSWFARSIFLSKIAVQVALKGAVVGAGTWFAIRLILAKIPLLVALGLAPLIALILLIVVGLLGVDDFRLVRSWLQRRASRV